MTDAFSMIVRTDHVPSRKNEATEHNSRHLTTSSNLSSHIGPQKVRAKDVSRETTLSVMDVLRHPTIHLPDLGPRHRYPDVGVADNEDAIPVSTEKSVPTVNSSSMIRLTMPRGNRLRSCRKTSPGVLVREVGPQRQTTIFPHSTNRCSDADCHCRVPLLRRQSFH